MSIAVLVFGDAFEDFCFSLFDLDEATGLLDGVGECWVSETGTQMSSASGDEISTTMSICFFDFCACSVASRNCFDVNCTGRNLSKAGAPRRNFSGRGAWTNTA